MPTPFITVRVELLDVDDAPWRQFQIAAAATFAHLHEAIQDACGWQQCHLYAFYDWTGRECIADSPDEDDDMTGPPADEVSLRRHLAAVGDECRYVYDFGDNWQHRVVVEDAGRLPARFRRRLLDGKRAFPPEDCGGIPGYEDCVAIKRGNAVDLDEEERLDREEWLGDWMPEEFDLEATRRRFDH